MYTYTYICIYICVCVCAIYLSNIYLHYHQNTKTLTTKDAKGLAGPSPTAPHRPPGFTNATCSASLCCSTYL